MSLNKLATIGKSFQAKEVEYRDRARRARKRENSDHYWNKYQLYLKAVQRAINLLHALQYPKQAFKADTHFSTVEYTAKLRRKQERREVRMAKHFYTPWFMQSSLNADYGTFNCDKCGREFFHSPSTITLAGKAVYSCACGLCTNEIIKKDWDQSPYH